MTATATFSRYVIEAKHQDDKAWCAVVAVESLALENARTMRERVRAAYTPDWEFRIVRVWETREEVE
jgi:hypothetical protein